MSARRTALLLAALVLVYAAFIGWRGVVLVADGRPAAVVLGVAVLLLPVVGLWLVWAELRFGRQVEVLGRELDAEGGLPVDDLPRRPSGRPERAAADELFERRSAEARAFPEDWRAWFRLALAYDAAGDRARARRTMRRAIAVHEGRPAD
ncbi:hypothetical protein [Motilibacter aurantiacus]|uniref:hypothetical protein n=1 Tax=Motilibacter aurantiacus TaxID=2714955 RepID=UPI00140E09EE|nr:hypothetical protein [Motilibacter aurantiacus]NHC44587.1 hypothetical protein [Motilibacter aurantiacus]